MNRVRARAQRAGRIALCACALAAPLLAHAAAELSLGEALRQALKSNPDTLLRQQQVVAAQGQALAARGSFDTVLGASVGRARALRPLRSDETAAFVAAGADPGRSQVLQSTRYSIGADRKLINGVEAGAGFTVSSDADNLSAAAGIAPQLSGTLSFTLRVPMARNAGRESAGAELDATQVEVEALRAELHHGNSQVVLDTTLAYWDWLAKLRRLEIAEASEKRLGDLIFEMQRLIAAGQMPRADIELALASRAEKTAQRLAAEQALQESRRSLARLLGLSAGRAREIGRPADDFPGYRSSGALQREDELIRDALSARADMEAVRYREQAARFRLTASRNNLKPRVDLNLSVSYTGLSEGATAWQLDRSLERNVGPSLGATVSLQWPWENNAALGAQRSAAATYDSATIRLRDLEQAIAVDVPVALAAVDRAAAQGAEGAQAVTRYEVSLRNERTKRRAGNATVIDVINLEDRLNSALLSEVALRQGFASSVARLRFELGSLILRDGEEYRVDLGALLGGSAFSE